MADEVSALILDESYPRNLSGASRILRQFTIFSFIFVANPCCAHACLSLATARLGTVGAWSSSMLYLTYTLSSVLGATYVVKQLGGRNAMILGMSFYVVYVGCFWVAVAYPSIKAIAAIAGAFIGGIGSGILWTAQGSYFTQAAEEHALYQGCDWVACTSSLSGTFAFAYLLEETVLHLSSYVMIEYLNMEWIAIFAIYAGIAVLSTLGMLWVRNYPVPRSRSGNDKFETQLYKITAAFHLLMTDSKMKYLIGLNAVFGFSGAFLNSFVSGQVVRIALQDVESKTVGIFVSWGAGVAAIASLLFGKLTHDYGKGPVMVFGNLMFLGVVLPFVVKPNLDTWTWHLLAFVYASQGIGRATFESTMKGVFADFFPYEKEGAFANIILQNGLFGSIGYILTFQLTCSTLGPYCIEYGNGTLHDVLSFELLVCMASIVAVLGYWRASKLYWDERLVDHSELESYRRGSIDAYRQSVYMIMESEDNNDD
jgi:MFS family permease